MSNLLSMSPIEVVAGSTASFSECRIVLESIEQELDYSGYPVPRSHQYIKAIVEERYLASVRELESVVNVPGFRVVSFDRAHDSVEDEPF